MGTSAPLLRMFCICAAAAAISASLSAADAKRKVIIDQDAFGGVNLQPMLLVIQSPDVDVLGITIESGDGWQKESVAAALRMLELIGRTDIPVVPGATYPLLNSEEATKRWERLYGKLPYKGAWMETWPDYNTVNRPHYHPAEVVPPLPEGLPTTQPAREVAANFLARKVREFPGQVSILALGPFTNVALAAKVDEGFAAGAKELCIMGGAFNPDASKIDEFSLQFINSPRVEFNSRWDPEAAKIMLHAGWRHITVLSTDATVGTKLTPELAQRAGAGPGKVAQYFRRFGQTGLPMWDEAAAAIWLDPSLIRHADRLMMDIDTSPGANYGGTLSWLPGAGPGLGEPEVTAVRAIDIPRFEGLFVSLLNR